MSYIRPDNGTPRRKEVLKAAFNRYKERHPERLVAYSQRYYTNNRVALLAEDKGDKSKLLKYRYGIDYNRYLEIAKEQDYKCACCSCPLDVENRRKTVVDHDHETDDIRGLLCRSCNIAVWVLDCIGLLDLAKAYLERYHAKRQLHNETVDVISQ